MRGLTHAVGWDFWTQIGSPRYVAAPMVDQSELPFRLLCRQLGTELTYTPMLHARLMVENPYYRAQHFDAHADIDEGPVFAQLAGHDPATVLDAARLVEPWGLLIRTSVTSLRRAAVSPCIHRVVWRTRSPVVTGT